jgi:AhpD family alkylhydroperoxidase
MDRKAKELVGIAAAVAGHCQKCFDYHYNEAGKLGIAKEDIAEAVELAKAIRQAGAKSMDEFVAHKQGRAANKE